MAKKIATIGLTLCMLLPGLSCFAVMPEMQLVSTTEQTLSNGSICR